MRSIVDSIEADPNISMRHSSQFLIIGRVLRRPISKLVSKGFLALLNFAGPPHVLRFHNKTPVSTGSDEA